MKRISQYNWNWWFIANLIGIVIGMSIALVANNTDDLWILLACIPLQLECRGVIN